MYRRLVAMAFVLTLFAPGLAASQDRGKVLMVIRHADVAAADALELVIAKEAGTIKQMLQQAGYRVEIASPTGERWGTQAAGLQPDRKLADVRVTDYRAIVIPCLAIDAADLHPDLAALIKSAVSAGRLVAAQNGGVTMLAKAGVLTGKKYAALEVADAAEEFAKGIYAGNGVVKDGTIITSATCSWMAHAYRGMEDGTAKMVQAVIAALDAR